VIDDQLSAKDTENIGYGLQMTNLYKTREEEKKT